VKAIFLVPVALCGVGYLLVVGSEKSPSPLIGDISVDLEIHGGSP
jgi:hypothetical protein